MEEPLVYTSGVAYAAPRGRFDLALKRACCSAERTLLLTESRAEPLTPSAAVVGMPNPSIRGKKRKTPLIKSGGSQGLDDRRCKICCMSASKENAAAGTLPL